jgi:hypothetical protein
MASIRPVLNGRSAGPTSLHPGGLSLALSGAGMGCHRSTAGRAGPHVARLEHRCDEESNLGLG